MPQGTVPQWPASVTGAKRAWPAAAGIRALLTIQSFAGEIVAAS